MKITTEVVNHLAVLSRLKLNEQETENFKNEFEKTLEQVKKLETINTDNINLDLDALNAETELTKDEIKPSLTVKEVIKNAPDSLGGSILIPVEII